MNTQLIGKHFIAQPAIEKHKIQYIHKYGSGYVKSGDVIKVISVRSNASNVETAGTDKLLREIAVNALQDNNFFIQLD